MALFVAPNRVQLGLAVAKDTKEYAPTPNTCLSCLFLAKNSAIFRDIANLF
jgi:hypothetical protein